MRHCECSVCPPTACQQDIPDSSRQILYTTVALTCIVDYSLQLDTVKA